MKLFHYQAATRDGSISNGTLSAPDRRTALEQFEALKLEPLSLSEEPSGRKEAKKQPEEKGNIRLRQSDVLEFTEELAELLRGGVQLEKSLLIIERREGKSRLPEVARQVREKIRDGKTLSEALKISSPAFGELYCRLVAAGEESGALNRILERQASHLKALQNLKSGVVFALIYPAFLCVSAVGVLAMFVTFLIPKLVELLESTGGTLPAGAELIVKTSEMFKSTWAIWLGLGLGACLFFSWLSQNRREIWDAIVMRVPLFGKVLHLRQQVLFLETMASLVENGLTVTNALTLTRNAVPSPLYQSEIDVIRKRVQDGERLSTSLVHSSYFPAILADLISVGEETGDLSGALGRAAIRFDGTLTRKVERLSAIIQPTVVIVMAAMVGGMAYLMITSIFQTVSGLGA
ncbi:MAG: type II secretion system F family protein [Verrucomicrobiales bacterium]|nr:type II secretion system F family protein [Verrucomicrobiales bacterium]